MKERDIGTKNQRNRRKGMETETDTQGEEEGGMELFGPGGQATGPEAKM